MNSGGVQTINSTGIVTYWVTGSDGDCLDWYFYVPLSGGSYYCNMTSYCYTNQGTKTRNYVGNYSGGQQIYDTQRYSDGLGVVAPGVGDVRGWAIKIG